jgi:crotonobetainyl-CoA:carnitine CoA-transferase CaiB-like acyl-CoA transferase
VFERNELPFAPITRPQDLFDDPHLNATGGLAPVRMNDGSMAKVPLAPFTLDGERPGIRLQPPHIGEHSRELLKEVGYGDDDIAALQTRHITFGD